MHECPECGQACDCDGEDLWHDNYLRCQCDCDEDRFDDEEENDYVDVQAESCVCGAYQWSESSGVYVQVADCCCPPIR